jgi:uncharacterized protein (DUF608 family)
MDDKSFANKCDGLFKKGSAYIEQNLFNGEYYEHKITDPVTFQYLDMTDSTVKVPDFQLGKGCLVDQLVGQMMSHICGLGYLGDKQHFQTTLNSIMKYNYLPDVSNHFNNMRSYVMGNEAGLLMASWPKDRLAIPFPYFNESMTGFEYSAAIEMIYEDQPENALKIIDSIRKRYDGRKRNPFDEPECGRHYARSMTSWGALLAWSNFHYSAVNKSMSFTSRPGVYFWSNGYAWGTCKVEDTTATVTVLHGKLELRSFSLEGKKVKKFKNLILVTSDSFSISFSI